MELPSARTDTQGQASDDRRAISGPLTRVKMGLPRSPMDSPPRRSGHTEARTAQIPKLIVRKIAERPGTPLAY